MKKVILGAAVAVLASGVGVANAADKPLLGIVSITATEANNARYIKGAEKAAAAALGTVLSIKPVIEVRNGVVEQESRQRTRAKSLRYLVDKVRSAGPLERLAVINADATDFPGFLEPRRRWRRHKFWRR